MSEKDRQDKPKIIIDSDWKAEAQREKERLASQAAEAAGSAGAAGPLPEADFAGLVNILMMQALVGLGGVRGPDGRPYPPNPEIAKYNIDLLAVLEDKTRNNLSAEEKRLLELALYELRMRYVQMVGAATGMAGLGGMPGGEERG
mgnify:CR=1 FL=1